jgi:hypothetical protein
MPPLELLARLAPVCGVPHAEALRFEEVAHQLRDLLAVLDDQDRCPVAHVAQCRSPPAAERIREHAFIDFSSPARTAVIARSDHRERGFARTAP